jgi:3',5'-cyclic AMP phosphodiesterase CpdA
MNIGILHLTDLHLKASENFIFNRIDRIRDALKIDFVSLERIYLVLTGDIVDKGVQLGYSHAKKFLLELKSKLESINNKSVVKFIIVPGNHDCNFEYDNVLAPQIAGHNLGNKLGLTKFGNYDKESKKIHT